MNKYFMKLIAVIGAAIVMLTAGLLILALHVYKAQLSVRKKT